MESRFELTFPLVLKWDEAVSITFALERGRKIDLAEGVYYLEGDNGSGKTTFLSLLSLTAGQIGNRQDPEAGTVCFNGHAYNGKGFDAVKAARVREKNFCIFPQKAFFLPVSTRDNYMILNGSNPEKAKTFSPDQIPDLLSGGQQQQVLMDIVLDDKKPVWFLDEPLTNLDAERRNYFWKIFSSAYRERLTTAFFIDHWLGGDIKKDRSFSRINTLRVFLENRRIGKAGRVEYKRIDLFLNRSPEAFLKDQIRKSATGRAARKTRDALDLKGDWGAAAGG